MFQNKLLRVLGLSVALVSTIGCGWHQQVQAAPATDAGTASKASDLAYPAAPTGNTVDEYHGVRIPDPYRWMDNADAKATERWVAAENQRTADFVAGSTREQIKRELTAMWDYPKYSPPDREGDRYFFTRNDGLQNQAVLYMLKKLGSNPILVLDPNKLSKDGTISLQTQAYSHDGRLLAYGLSQSGSDRQEIHVREVDSGQDRKDLIKWTKFTSIAWKHDNSGFYYNRFPMPGSVPPAEENNHSKIYWHALGTSQNEDRLVLERADNFKLDLAPFVTDDGRYLCVYITEGTSPQNRFYYQEIDGAKKGDRIKEGDFAHLLDAADASYSFIDNVGPTFYFQTDLDAPRGRIIAIDVRKPGKENWQTIVPQGKDILAFSTIVDHRLVLGLLHDAASVLKIDNLDGTPLRDVRLPALGSVAAVTGRQTDTELFFIFSSYAYPGCIFRYDFPSDTLEQYHKSEIKANLSAYETRQVFATSKDGTRVPLFITYKKGIQLDGSHPTLLYGYGGFDVNETPAFDLARVIWLKHGGVYADAVLRGGGEYGEQWHEQGMLSHKQNTFDDFIGCAQWLVDHHYTRPSKLAIEGGSNGGLLVAACMLQRPELFGAVLSEVPVTDMLRYPKFAAGVAWLPEYGDPANPVDFNYLRAYSPLHNIKVGITYPAVLVTSADSDDRVDPSHAKKFIATLQASAELTAAQGKPTNPILLRVETKAGHGGGKPTRKIIDELSDEFAFLFRVLGMDPAK